MIGKNRKMNFTKKAQIKEAVDLILLVLFAVIGFFILYSFFLNASDSSDDSLKMQVVSNQHNQELITLMYLPVEIEGGLSVQMYQLLISSVDNEDYVSIIESNFDGLFGSGSWSIKITEKNSGDVIDAGEESEELIEINPNYWYSNDPKYDGDEEIFEFSFPDGREIEIRIRVNGEGRQGDLYDHTGGYA